MNIYERADKAAELKKNAVYNCAQAVAVVLADQTDLSEAELLKINSGFAVGMGNMEATCGALVGAVIMAGLSKEGKGSVRLAKQMSVQFAKKTGASLCKDLKGRDTKVVLCPCEECVRNAVLIYDEIVGLKENTGADC